ncbi:MAG TPA: quinone oxidoreductase [Candidatus Methylomirabilis sp.]|nr:quinone oxidoreductase [Candidatus Methylomirabilis sp.]
MRMIVVPRLGGPEVLTMREVEQPAVGPGEVLVKIQYAGLTYGDVYQREGTYRSGAPLKESEAPLRIGGEGAGTVAAVGANVAHLKPGDEVVYCDHLGSYAEYAAVPAWRVVKVPPGISLRDAAAVFSLGCTAHYLAHDSGKLRPGIACLIHAGAGGLGHLLVQLGKLLGASVLTTVGSEEKGRFVRGLGADKVILYRAEDFLAAVRAWGDGKGVEVVYDSVGQATIQKSIQAVRPHGLCVLCGNTSGLVETISPMDLAAAGSIFFTRPRLSHHMRTRDEIGKRAEDIFSALRDGRLRVAVCRIFPLEQAGEAHRLLQSRETIGKIMLAVG